MKKIRLQDDGWFTASAFLVFLCFALACYKENWILMLTIIGFSCCLFLIFCHIDSYFDTFLATQRIAINDEWSDAFHTLEKRYLELSQSLWIAEDEFRDIHKRLSLLETGYEELKATVEFLSAGMANEPND